MVDVWSSAGPAMACSPSNESKDTAEKVLRRAHLARVVSNLKSRLALATFKTQRGLENCNFESLEALALASNESSPPQSQSPSPRMETASARTPAMSQMDSSPPQLRTPLQRFSQKQFDVERKDAAESMPPPPLRGYSPDKRDFTAYAANTQSRRNMLANLGRGSPARQQAPLPSLGAALTPTAAAPGAAPPRRKRAKTLDQAGKHAPSVKSGLSQSMSVPSGLQDSLHSKNNDGPVLAPSTPPPPSGPIPALPSTPTSQQARNSDQEGANLLLFLATSPGRGLPRTPRTPDFHLNEYCNIFTPSPGGNHIPHPMTPSSIVRARQHLNFESS